MTASSTFISAGGDGYELQMGRWSRRLAPLFLDFAGITHAESVLDVGCGTGSLSFCLAQQADIGAVRGLDFAPVYVDYARHRNDDKRIEFEVGDACAMPYPDASFDHTLSMLVLQFVPEADRAIREMRRVTRPGGTVAAATWDSRGGLVTYRMFFDTAAMLSEKANERRGRTYTRPLSRPGELARAWTEAGLEDVVQDMRTIRMDFQSFDDYWAPCEGKDGPLADYVGSLDSEEKVRLREALRLAYLDGEPDGARSYAATSWVVKGTVPA
ncbi:MAG: class I SAM-dependent methyltransferase [Chloroflexota bacterium]